MEEKARILLTHHDLVVEVDEHPGQELIDHMTGTVLGQPGTFRYQQPNLKDKLLAPGENYFLYLKKQGKMLGSVGFIGRHTATAGVAHDSWMIRFFSIKAPMGSVPRERKKMVDRDESRRSSVLNRFIRPVMANPSQLRDGDREKVQPAIIYALIEKKNLRSMNFSTQMGLETVGEVSTISFTRLRPRRSDRVEKLAGSGIESMRALLHEYYSGYTLFSSDPLFREPGYFVIRESGRVVAGIQAYQVSWRIIDFGNRMTNGFMRLITRIPWVRRRFDPRELRLLAFDALYCEPGKESALYELMEGVLERTGNYVGLMMLDENSDLFRIFSLHGKLGFVSRFIGIFRADVRARFINLPDRVREHFLDRPAYIPTFDNT